MLRKHTSTKEANVLSLAYLAAIDDMEDMDRWEAIMEDSLELATINGEEHEVEEEFMDLLIKADLIDYDGMTERMDTIIKGLEVEYSLNKAVDGIVRRFNYAPNKTRSALFDMSIEVQEDTKYMRNEFMYEVLTEVFEMLPKGHKVLQEKYIMTGCDGMEEGVAYISEYSGDRRGRTYQKNVRGPSGANSDRARALYDYHGVSKNYSPEYALYRLKEEMQDMGSFQGEKNLMKEVRRCLEDPADYILNNLLEEQSEVSKAASFVKAAKIVQEIEDHLLTGSELPYIGMGFGIDAKCSGPQLGALMCNDTDILVACGFTTKEVDDAYELCILNLRAKGFYDIKRKDIKKPFMGIFYGQGFGAYLDQHIVDNEDITQAMWDSIHPQEVTEDRAKLFHTTVTKSFGVKMARIRRKIASFGMDYDAEEMKSDKPTRHMMPDGFVVEMDYRIMVDMEDQVVGYDTPLSDYKLEVGDLEVKLSTPKFKTDTYDMSNFARNGFVNMIQATDALVARLTIVNAYESGVTHFTNIHDCFRVNIHDIEKLSEAVKLTYTQLFGVDEDTPTKYLPEGTDILAKYFEGAEEALKDNYKGTIKPVSQFIKGKSMRRLHKVDGILIKDLIEDLGNTKYFAK